MFKVMTQCTNSSSAPARFTIREGAVVTLFETKATGIQLLKRVTALKFGMTVIIKRYNMEL